MDSIKKPAAGHAGRVVEIWVWIVVLPKQSKQRWQEQKEKDEDHKANPKRVPEILTGASFGPSQGGGLVTHFPSSCSG